VETDSRGRILDHHEVILAWISDLVPLWGAQVIEGEAIHVEQDKVSNRALDQFLGHAVEHP